jgi:hypothetical protein
VEQQQLNLRSASAWITCAEAFSLGDQMHTFTYVVDSNGTHWLQGPDEKSYFNGVTWVQVDNPKEDVEVLGELSIQDFLIVLASTLDYGQAL